MRSETYLKMIPRLVASFSESMSSFRATATHFIPKTMIFAILPTLKIPYLDLQILNCRPHMYCKSKIYILQIQNYGIKTPIIYCKYRIYVLQIHKDRAKAPIIY